MSAALGGEDKFKVVGVHAGSMSELGDALELHPKGLTVRFEVVSGSRRLAVPSGYNAWRCALEARLTEEPSRGRANRQLILEVAKLLGVPEDRVEILSGQKSSHKVLLVKGLEMAEALQLLKRRTGAP